MKQIIAGVVLTILGALLIIFRDRFAKGVIAYQNKVNRFHFGYREFVISRVMGVIVGSFFLVLGLLVVFGIFQLKI